MNRIVIWDIWIRLFHWSLVCCVFFLLFSGKTGNGFYDWHRYVGEVVAALILFRVAWGLWGTSNNRLSVLVSNPVNALTHLKHLFSKTLPPERGHNPAGAWASLLMLLLIALQAVSGLFIADEDELLEGAFYGSLSSEWSEQLLQIHYFNSGLIISIVIVHILMIVIYRLWAHINLVSPMITGMMQWPDKITPPPLTTNHWLAGFFTALAAFAVTGFFTGWFVP